MGTSWPADEYVVNEEDSFVYISWFYAMLDSYASSDLW